MQIKQQYRGSMSNMEVLFDIEAQRKRPTVNVSMIAKNLQIEKATL